MPLRRVAKFAPNRRARLGGAGDRHPARRATRCSGSGSATRVIEEPVSSARAVAAGRSPAAADPVEVAALAYLIRPDGWRDLVGAAAEAVRAEADSAAVAQRIREAEQRAARAEHDRAVARVEADKLRDELARLRDELTGAARRGARRWPRRCARRRPGAQGQPSCWPPRRAGPPGRRADHEAEVRRLRAKLAEAEAGRRGQPGDRQGRPARSTTPGCGCCWRRSARPPSGCAASWPWSRPTELPADFVADTRRRPARRAGAAGARALDADDPGRLDQLLALPRAHLIVDGYNVTKTRLRRDLAGAAAQAG